MVSIQRDLLQQGLQPACCNLKHNDDLEKLNSKCTDIAARLRSEEKLRKKAAKKGDQNLQLVESLNCNFCEVKLESISKLQVHVRLHDMDPKSVQTEEKCEIKVEK